MHHGDDGTPYLPKMLLERFASWLKSVSVELINSKGKDNSIIKNINKYHV